MNAVYILNAGDVDVSGAPELIRILPVGHVVSSKGEFDVDEESLEAMKAEIAQRGVDLVVDYEHQTLKGVQAPAAGWVKELLLKDGHIQARVEWTQPAAEYLKKREYRYLSPVISVRHSDGKATGLHSLALTNTPAIEGMSPIVNSQHFEGGQKSMEPNENTNIAKALAQLLGLDEGAGVEDILEAVKAGLAENKSLKDAQQPPPEDEETVVANKAVCELLGLKAGTAASEVTAKIMELKGGIVDGVNLAEKLAALEAKEARRTAESAVQLALKAGKLTPAQEDWAIGYALSDPKGFDAFVEKAARVVPMGEVNMGDDTKVLKSDGVDESTMLICKMMGVSQEDVQKYGKE